MANKPGEQTGELQRLFYSKVPTHIEVVEGVGQLSAPALLLGSVVRGGGLGGVGDAADRLLQLFVDQVPVGFVGSDVRVLQAGLGRRVQDGHVLLQDSSGCRHLIAVTHIFQLLLGKLKGKKIHLRALPTFNIPALSPWIFKGQAGSSPQICSNLSAEYSYP